MNSYGPRKTPAGKAGSASTNPFARALAETEKFSLDKKPGEKNPLSEALSRTGGSFGDFNSFSPDMWDKQQQQELERQRNRELMRKKLHDQVNPVDSRDVFNAREKQVKEEIEKLRAELKLLAKDMAKFYKDVEVTLMAEVPSPGEQGKYHFNFFRMLRKVIELIRQQIRSAPTWATTLNTKKKQEETTRWGIAV